MFGLFYLDNRRIFALSFLIVAISIAYYFIVFLPQKEKDKVAQAAEAKQAETKKEERDRLLLDSCLKDVERDYTANWSRVCSEEGLEAECQLPGNKATAIENNRKQYRDDCFRKYGKK